MRATSGPQGAGARFGPSANLYYERATPAGPHESPARGRRRQKPLGGAVPSPAAAFLLALITLPTLFWLVTLKRTTEYTRPELWLMDQAVPQVRTWVESTLPMLHSLMLGISGLGSGWFVAAGFAMLGLIALAKGRQDLVLVLAAGVLAFPIEWALKYFVAIPPITLPELVAAIFNVNSIGLDDVADFLAGHALRAVAFYGLAAFCVARWRRPAQWTPPTSWRWSSSVPSA